MSYTTANKLQILMMCDIYEALGIKNSFDPNVIRSAVETDNLWAIGWEYQSLSTSAENDDPEEVHFVCNVLDMYGLLEFTYSHLSQTQKDQLAAEVPNFSANNVIFPGFDANNESRYFSVSRMLKIMNRFDTQDIFVNSHRPTIAIYERMLEVFLPARADFHHDRGLTYEALRDTLLAAIHPSNR